MGAISSEKAQWRADALFTDAFWRFNVQWGDIWSFREAALGGIPTQESKFRQKMNGLVHRMRPGGDLQHSLVDAESFFKSGADRAYVEKSVTASLRGAQAAVNAASIVFGHSILESVMHSSLKIICILDRGEFINRIGKTRVSIAEALSDNLVGIVDQKIRSELKDLERKGLVTKSDFLHDVCKPEHPYDGLGYKFDRQRLRDLDDLRHRIVHGPSTDVQYDVRSHLDYLNLSCMYFIYMLHLKYMLKIIPIPSAVQPLLNEVNGLGL